MYELRFNKGEFTSEFTIPKKNIVAFSMLQAMKNGIFRGHIHDDATAIEYLNSIGYEVRG